MMQSRFVRRALMRGGMAAAAGALVPRHRVSAALAGAAVGAAIENPLVGAPLALVAVSRRDRAGLAAGAVLGVATSRVWPTAPRTVEELRRHATKHTVPRSADGAGIVIVVNGTAGSNDTTVAEHVRARLPAVDLVELEDGDDVGDALEKAAATATTAFGAAGGDGTMSAAAALAHARGVPLVVLPTGTLNHFARDLGVLSIDDGIDAVERGEVVEVDIATIGERTFVNTASFGAYTDLVDARERLEGRIGKWPAVAIALARVLRRAVPVALAIDGRPRRLWLGFIGNGHYRPSGFAPTWREVLDDRLLDVRLVDAAQPFARTKLVLSVLTGRLGRSAIYEQRLAKRIELRSDDGAIRIALDGEVGDVDASVCVTKLEPTVRVYAPHG